METDTVLQFDLEAPRLRRIRKVCFIRTLIFFICFSLIAVFSDVSKSTINGVPLPVRDERLTNAIIMLIVTIVVLFFQQSKIVRTYKGFTIRINNDMLERSNARNNRMLVYFTEVEKAVVTINGSFAIYLVNKPMIFIPRQVNNRDELETLLNERVPVLIKAPDTFYYRHYATLSLLVLQLLLAAFVFKNKILVSAISLPLLVLLGYDIKKRIKVSKTPITKISDKGIILIIIGLMLFVVENLVYKLFFA